MFVFIKHSYINIIKRLMFWCSLMEMWRWTSCEKRILKPTFSSVTWFLRLYQGLANIVRKEATLLLMAAVIAYIHCACCQPLGMSFCYTPYKTYLGCLLQFVITNNRVFTWHCTSEPTERIWHSLLSKSSAGIWTAD
jgi:hypothetical protein